MASASHSEICYDKNAAVLSISQQPGTYEIAEETLPGELWRFAHDSSEIVDAAMICHGFYRTHVLNIWQRS